VANLAPDGRYRTVRRSRVRATAGDRSATSGQDTPTVFRERAGAVGSCPLRTTAGDSSPDVSGAS
jgi:hypothetical protein